MTINFDEDLILPITTAIVTVLFVIGHQTLALKSDIDYWMGENTVLFSEISTANREIDTLTKELDQYKVTESSLVRMGASRVEAQRVMVASEVYGLDPKLMGH